MDEPVSQTYWQTSQDEQPPYASPQQDDQPPTAIPPGPPRPTVAPIMPPSLAEMTEAVIQWIGHHHLPLYLMLGFHNIHRKYLTPHPRIFRRMECRRNPWLYQLYLDPSRRMVIRKGVQVMQTETVIVKKVIAGCLAGRKIMYILPSMRIAQLFVKDRVDPLIARVPYYQHLIRSSLGKSSTTVIKHLADGSVMFVGAGAQNEDYFQTFAMDTIVYDEYDSLVVNSGQAVIDLAEDREKGAEEPDSIKMGNPMAADIMIDAEYKRGTQTRWHVACPHCGYQQEIDWFSGYVRDRGQGQFEPRYDLLSIPGSQDLPYCCVHCQKLFDPCVEGTWVDAYPSRTTKSYHISRTMASVPGRHVRREMMDEFFDKAVNSPKAMKRFYRSNLGIGHEMSSEDAITEGLIASSCDPTLRMSLTIPGICLVGGDIKNRWWHFIIGQIADDFTLRIHYIGKTLQTRDFIDQALASSTVQTRIAVLDAQGLGGRIIREQILPHVQHDMIWRAFAKQHEKIVPAQRLVQYHRDDLLEDVLDALKMREIILPQDAAGWKEFLGHMTSNVKIPITDPVTGSTTHTWKRRSHREDDWLNAMGYLLRARQVFQLKHGVIPPSREHVQGDITEEVQVF